MDQVVTSLRVALEKVLSSWCNDPSRKAFMECMMNALQLFSDKDSRMPFVPSCFIYKKGEALLAHSAKDELSIKLTSKGFSKVFEII